MCIQDKIYLDTDIFIKKYLYRNTLDLFHEMDEFFG